MPEPDDATAKRIYRAATAPPTRLARGQLGRRGMSSRISRRARLALAVALIALVAVPAGLAFGRTIVDLFEGTPAPPAISTDFQRQNRVADYATTQGFAAKFPHADVSKAHGVVEILTPDGPEHLWAAPSDQGGLCWFIDFANDPAGQDGQPGFGGCDSADTGALKIVPGDVWVLPHPSLMTVYGRVHVVAARAELTFADGSTRTVPVVEGFFLDSAPKGSKVTKITAYDEGDSVVAEWATP